MLEVWVQAGRGVCAHALEPLAVGFGRSTPGIVDGSFGAGCTGIMQAQMHAQHPRAHNQMLLGLAFSHVFRLTCFHTAFCVRLKATHP